MKENTVTQEMIDGLIYDSKIIRVSFSQFEG